MKETQQEYGQQPLLKRFICTCGKSYSRNSTLFNHIAIKHNKDKAYISLPLNNGRRLGSKNKISKDEKQKILDKNLKTKKKLYPCKCQKAVYKSAGGLSNHIKKVHGRKDERFKQQGKRGRKPSKNLNEKKQSNQSANNNVSNQLPLQCLSKPELYAETKHGYVQLVEKSQQEQVIASITSENQNQDNTWSDRFVFAKNLNNLNILQSQVNILQSQVYPSEDSTSLTYSDSNLFQQQQQNEFEKIKENFQTHEQSDLNDNNHSQYLHFNYFNCAQQINETFSQQILYDHIHVFHDNNQ